MNLKRPLTPASVSSPSHKQLGLDHLEDILSTERSRDGFLVQVEPIKISWGQLPSPPGLLWLDGYPSYQCKNKPKPAKRRRGTYWGSVLKMCVCYHLCLTVLESHGLWPTRLFVHGILQARILEWVAISSSRASSRSRAWTRVFCTAGGLFTPEPLGKPP